MKIEVRYFSRSGNTKKVAEAIAEVLRVTAEDLSSPLAERADVLFLGSAVYAAGIDEAVKTFLRENKDKIGTLYNFSTAAAMASTYKQVKKVADECGIAMAKEEFHCRGKFLFMHGKHPDEKDLAAAKKFAEAVAAQNR